MDEAWAHHEGRLRAFAALLAMALSRAGDRRWLEEVRDFLLKDAEEISGVGDDPEVNKIRLEAHRHEIGIVMESALAQLDETDG